MTAQYLDHVYSILWSQLRSRVLTVATIALVLTLLIFLLINRWVLQPVSALLRAAHQWSTRNFAPRALVSGSSDMRMLTSALNSMASSLQAAQEQEASELARARLIQTNLLPNSMPSVPGLSLAALYRPAHHVAGDLYDVFRLPSGKIALLILDVSGHGLSAALMTGVIKMSLHRRLAECDDLSQAMSLVNSDLLDCATEGQFVTTCVALWDPPSSTCTYAAAGHPGPLWLSADSVRSLPTNGPLLGVLTNGHWDADTLSLSNGDRLILYTDGVSEAGAPGDQLGTPGLQQVARRTRELNLPGQVQAIADEVGKLCAELQTDDITILALEVMPLISRTG